MSVILTLGLVAMIVLGGCGSDDQTQGAIATPAEPAESQALEPNPVSLPQLDATTVGFPLVLSGYERLGRSTEETPGDPRFAEYGLPGEDATLLLGVTPGGTVEQTDDQGELVVDRELEGFACGSDAVFDVTCRSALDGGVFSISLAQEAQIDGVVKTYEELVQVGAAFYKQAPGEDGSSPEADGALDEPCDMVSIGAVEEVLGDYLEGGALAVDEEYSWVEARQASCALSLPAGTFGADPDFWGTLTIDRYSYDDGADGVRFNLALECSYGGTSQAEVFESSSDCYDYKTEGTNTEKSVKRVGAGGVVTDGQISAVLAADGPYWYRISLSGINGSADYDPLLLGVAQLLEGD